MFRFKKEMKRFDKKVWLATPTMHGEELNYMTEAYETNWMSTVGENISRRNIRISEKPSVNFVKTA